MVEKIVEVVSGSFAKIDTGIIYLTNSEFTLSDILAVTSCLLDMVTNLVEFFFSFVQSIIGFSAFQPGGLMLTLDFPTARSTQLTT